MITWIRSFPKIFVLANLEKNILVERLYMDLTGYVYSDLQLNI